MGKFRVIVPIILALLIAVSGSYFLYKYLKGLPASGTKNIKVEAEAVPILVAAIDLKWGTKISKDMVQKVNFLKESLPAGCFKDISKVEGRVVISGLKQKDPITESRLAPEDVNIGGVSAIISSGKRAVAVKGDKVIGISGFIKPGDRVDILVTLKDTKTKKDTTKIVLESILVLATGHEMEKNKEGKPASVDVYTLEVTPDEGEKLGLAAAKGKLQFALRNVKDQNTVFTKGATISQTLASYRGPQETLTKSKSEEVPKVYKRAYTIEEIKGGKMSRRKFDF